MSVAHYYFSLEALTTLKNFKVYAYYKHENQTNCKNWDSVLHLSLLSKEKSLIANPNGFIKKYFIQNLSVISSIQYISMSK